MIILDKLCEVCNGEEHDPSDHPYIPHVDESVLGIAGITESHNPLDIVGVVQEKNLDPKQPEDVDEGGMGSGRNPEGGGDSSGSQPGPLISFGTETIKELMDAKLKESCPCRQKK